jgi:hypothetical protein
VLIEDQPIGAGLSRNLGSPTAPGEAVESELDRLIERRSRQKDPDEESELWRASVRAYEEKRRQMARLEWHAFHSIVGKLLGIGPSSRALSPSTRSRRRS